MIAAGIVEGSISLNQIDFSKMEPVRSGDVRARTAHSRSFNGGKGSAGGRTAFFLKGKIRGDYLLTAAYDSEKTTRDRLFRDIQPDEYYPIYGDSAQRGFDTQSTGRLYVRIDKDKSYLLYGDYTTASSDTVRQISQYSRSLNGVKGHYETDIQGHRVEVTGFAAHDTLRQMVEEFAANGTSGPFQLRHGDLARRRSRQVLRHARGEANTSSRAHHAVRRAGQHPQRRQQPAGQPADRPARRPGRDADRRARRRPAGRALGSAAAWSSAMKARI